MCCDALVLGAGAAGIGAARELRAHGLSKVLVLEARDRVGGRCHCSDELGAGTQLDHGGQWIRGASAEHPMVQLATAQGLRTCCQGEYGVGLLLHEDGKQPLLEHEKSSGQAFRRLASLIEALDSNCTWLQGLQRLGGEPVLFGQEPSARERALLHHWVYRRCEREGARLDRWSARSGRSPTCLEGPNAEVEGGYGALLAAAAEGLEILYGRRVVEVEYPDEAGEEVLVAWMLSGFGVRCAEVVVRCMRRGEDGQEVQEVFRAPRCIIALPLGVLRSGSVSFLPPLPRRQVQAISQLGLAHVEKVELLWEERWWPPLVSSIRIASRAAGLTYHPWPCFMEPTATRKHPQGWAVLVCFVTGRFAEELAGKSALELAGSCHAALQAAFPNVSVPQPRAVHATRWGQDELSMGSWTYLAAGSSLADATALAEPVGRGGCLVLAGEHCCDGSRPGLDLGTVHGAHLSGRFAASGLLARLPACGCR